MTSNLPSAFENKTLMELVRYFRGSLLIDIGAGRYDQGVYDALATAWTRGYEEGVKSQIEAKQ